MNTYYGSSNKYGARKASSGQYQFDSKKEAKRWEELKLFQQAGVISDLQRQVHFEIIPKQNDADGHCIERKCEYVADFTYQKDGKLVVEDVKGYREGAAYNYFVIKRKLMLQVHGIRVTEI